VIRQHSLPLIRPRHGTSMNRDRALHITHCGSPVSTVLS
jgi:hypothetical protein